MSKEEHNIAEVKFEDGTVIVLREDHKGGYWLGQADAGKELVRRGARKLDQSRSRKGFLAWIEDKLIRSQKEREKAKESVRFHVQRNGVIILIDICYGYKDKLSHSRGGGFGRHDTAYKAENLLADRPGQSLQAEDLIIKQYPHWPEDKVSISRYTGASSDKPYQERFERVGGDFATFEGRVGVPLDIENLKPYKDFKIG